MQFHKSKDPAVFSQAEARKLVQTSGLASAAAARQDWPEAARLWRALTDEFSNRAPAEVWIGLSTALRRSGRYSPAERAVDLGLKAYKNYIGLLMERAEIASARRDWPEAIKRWHSTIEKIDDKTRLVAAYVRLTMAYAQNQDYDDALKTAAEGLDHNPDSAAILTGLAEVYSLKDDWPAAIERWQSIIEKLGNDAPAESWAGLARALRKNNQLAEAEIAVENALLKFPVHLGLLVEHAEIANTRRDWPTAIERWQSVLEFAAGRPDFDIPKRIYARANLSFLKRIADIKSYRAEIKKYAKNSAQKDIAVYTSFTPGYDWLKLPEDIDPRLDYLVYADGACEGYGIFKIKPLDQPEFDNDGARATRYPKTHPHILLKGYKVAIWMDTSLMLVGDIMPLVEDFLKSDKPIGSATHPSRQSLAEEFEACLDLKKDDPAILKKQAEFYKSIGFETNDLSNNGLLFFNLEHPQLASALEIWWDQICTFSKRDQLSFNYSLAKAGIERYHLTNPPADIRDHPSFIFTPHQTTVDVADELNKLLAENT